MNNFIEHSKGFIENLFASNKSVLKSNVPRQFAEDELPLRAELFGAVQMAQHGKLLAESHVLRPDRARDHLLPRLAENHALLSEACNVLTMAVKADRQITPAAEWLLDNFYLIEDQIRTAKRHLPKGYSRELPRLLKGPSAGRPRVYDIALETISHGDGRVNPESLSRFVMAYQQVSVLKLGELWAIPIMLRLALIENLRRVAARLAASIYNRNLADAWADQMMETAEKDPTNLILLVADMARSNPPMASSFVAELVRRLQGQSPSLTLPLTWIEHRLAATGMTVEQLVQQDTQQQAADQVSVSNSIGSLRFLGTMDWREFVEAMSVVERTLRQDRDVLYGKMDFATRDQYRHVIEKLAKKAAVSEATVAQKAIDLACQVEATPENDGRATHVGYYLIGDGVRQLEQAIGVRLSALQAIKRRCARAPLTLYLGAILLLTGIISAGFLWHAAGDYLDTALLLLLGVVAVLGASQLALALVNWLATLLTLPRALPRMNFSEGIPASARTLVVVPSMLTGSAHVDDLCEALEVRFLANRDRYLDFCLLTDFTDAASESMPEDAALLAQAQQNIERLNLKYADSNHVGQGDKFLLLHRPRRWNAQEKIWMGYERKRGKLADLNQFLRGGNRDAFSCIVGRHDAAVTVQYVITLDTDTMLPRDAARQFVATIAHPLNRPRFDASGQRVIAGYGILQPRVSVSLPGANASWYEQLVGGEPGVDPYTRTVSDVYQDVFGEGSFIGKGIYAIDAFEQVLGGRFPDNLILSHDLLEGCYARSGLLSDAQLYEEYPARYSADVSRRHRWIRGDWQQLSWLLPRVPAPSARWIKNPLSALSRWKIFDNLRRSLSPSALLLLLLLGWLVLPSAEFWTSAVLAILLLPPFSATLQAAWSKADDVLWRQHVSATLHSAGRHFSQAMLALAFLPFEAYYSLDAIVRSLWRLTISRRNLLQWKPSGAPNGGQQESIGDYLRLMASAPLLALAATALLLAIQPVNLLLAAPILLLWAFSPLIAWWISRPIAPRIAQLTAAQTEFLQQLARKNWAFFETFVGADDHWLPPDNVQEQPVAVIAHRTSPTNIGMSLLANLAAYDFGYVSAGKLIERSANTLQTLTQLERYQGHFYNWYDTHSLKPLHPIYISTVDSGNLAGHFLTLRPGLLDLQQAAIVNPRLFDGLAATLNILLTHAQEAGPEPLRVLQQQMEATLAARPPTLSMTWRSLERLHAGAEAFQQTLKRAQVDDLSWWANALLHQCRDARDELRRLAPWSAQAASAQVFDLLGGDIDIDRIPTLQQLATLAADLQPAIAQRRSLDGMADKIQGLDALQAEIGQASKAARERIAEIERLAQQAADFSLMEYGFLFDQATQLLAIGYNVSDLRLDASCYDLLASEARLSSFVAISQGQVPQENWFALGRQLTLAGGEPILLSWSGSMFEYLMPLLVMPTYANTLLDQTYQAAVQRQIDYGAQRNVPWGVSESGYNAFDARLNYQYRAFGVPGLGLKRGLGADLVIAPYASMMALMVAPEQACMNLQRLAQEGYAGRYGFYEAIDYTVTRLPRGQECAVIRSFMAHHQGMGFLSLAYLLLDQPMQKRFASDPLFQATLLLLQERIPKATALYSNPSELANIRTNVNEQQMPLRILARADTRMPEVQLLSNGKYHVMVTNAGGSYSRWKDLAVSRWREDSTCDNWGTFFYVRDSADGSYWSSAYQPTRKQPEPHSYEVIFSEGRAEFKRRDNGFDMHTEIVVSPEDDIELRRCHIVNRSRSRRTIDVTSYSEVVLAPAPADATHPAFSNLFVQTEIIAPSTAILCTRRPRSIEEKMPWLFHLMAVHGAHIGEISYETNRTQFIGRGNTVAAPQAMTRAGALGGSAGSVLDPIAAIRYQITLEPEQSVIIDMVTGVVDTREHALNLIDKYRDRHLADRVFELAWTHSQVILRQLNATESDAQLYGSLANSIIYSNALLRADAAILLKNRRGQSGLWSYAISGDLPIVLVQIKDMANIELVRQLVQAHSYWRMKGLAVDLVIWNEDHAGYRQVLQDQILGMIASGTEAHAIDRPGGIFVRLADQIASDDRILLQSVARVILSDSKGSLAEQIQRRSLAAPRMPALAPTRARFDGAATVASLPQRDLILANGIGGFSKDGREYVITTSADTVTPAPWVNVLANPHFGTVISESGQAYTWGENAHEFRLTPWNNDPVSDAGGEAFYLRDEESGYYWSPAPLPSRGDGDYVSRHGFGYSVFEHIQDGIHSELWVYVAIDASIKFSVLKVKNVSGSARKMSATGYVEWVLGDLRAKSSMHVITESDPLTGALFARNSYNTEFPERIALFYVNATSITVTGDRTEFIGRNGSLKHPAALHSTHLSGKLGAGLDPCAAIQVPFDLADGQEREIVFMLGVAGRRSADVSTLVQRYRSSSAAHDALQAVQTHWQHTLGAVQVETPEPALNVQANGWLMYQTIACRLWARSGFYQSGGAFGFRDQLQDVMAMVHTQPHLLREHLLLCAAHQFVEGDVQHWWHPPSDRGVRTHCSDDYLWLPLATQRYVHSTGDTGVLDEVAPFLEGRLVNADEDSYYDLPNRSSESASLYQHCVRAIERGLRFGVHGLPLIGSCDWNDGMDKVGAGGKGESVWLAFFLYDILQRFAPVARLHEDAAFAERCLNQAETLRQNIEKNAWDGEWYRRAYFDDGTPLGSASNVECQIDSISQSWAVLSGAGDPERIQSAMQSVDARLVRRDSGLVQLLDPPFDHADLNPGYIRGYVPGVRENGGQYTHAAIWTAMAFAKLGNNERAWELLRMINPVHHGASAADIAIYKVEPYVIAADVYGVAPHVGRGGWTWYTGSSGWMYRLMIESLLGLTLEHGKQLRIHPCLPPEWPSYTLHYRYRDTRYQIVVTQATEAGGSTAIMLDGVLQDSDVIALVDDKKSHLVAISVSGSAASVAPGQPPRLAE